MTVAPARPPARVLLIDDQPLIGEAVRRLIVGEPDLVFHYCREAAKALDAAKSFQPTVILQDLVMPDIDGLTLVERFRADEATRDVPMIVLSTKEEPAVKAEAFARGANDYLVKLPDNGQNVIDILHKIAHSHQATVLCVSHDPRLIRHADRVLEMEDGLIRNDWRHDRIRPASLYQEGQK